MPFAITPEGNAQLDAMQRMAAEAALIKRNGGSRPAGGTPAHAMADGAQDFHDGEHKKRAARAKADADVSPEDAGAERNGDNCDDDGDEMTEKGRHPQTGQYAEDSYAPFGLQRPYVQPGHAAQSPMNSAGPNVAQVPNVGAQTGYRPMVDAINTHGVPRTQVNYGSPVHQAPGSPMDVSAPHGGSLGGSLANNPSHLFYQTLDYTSGVTPQATSQNVNRPDYHVAPTGSTPPAPRGTGPATTYPTYSGA